MVDSDPARSAMEDTLHEACVRVFCARAWQAPGTPTCLYGESLGSGWFVVKLFGVVYDKLFTISNVISCNLSYFFGGNSLLTYVRDSQARSLARGHSEQ